MIDVKSKVNSFFIFNSTFGPREGEELKRILFFHPNQVTPHAQKIQVGLCEAVVQFMTTFSTEPCEALQTQTKRYIFYQPEKDFWMVLVVRIPYTTKAATGTGNEKKDIIESSVMQDFLVSAYKMFRMFIGPMKDIPTEDIYSKCEQFFTPYIMSRNIANDITNVIQGINYLPLEKNSFFKVVCFIDLLEINYPDFKCVSFVYNDKLIWNGLATSDMLTLYQYLVQTLLPKQVEKEIQGGAVTAAQRHGRYISPPEGIRNADDLLKLHKVYVMREDDSETKLYYLVIYRTLSATVCFTVDVNTILSIDIFKALDSFIGPQLSTIASSISEQCALHAMQSAQLSNMDHSFIYFNRLNLAYKTSSPGNSLTPSTTIKPEVLSIIAGIHSERKSLGNYGEIIIKTPDEYWITGKSSNDREFYVIIQEKNANLKDIADEVRRICEDQMKGIFFYPM
ncbi:vacuolar fusion protein CCZ1 homolog [Maniola hyperantus]|uniref:vacuolar fusion protein CCZ1 homolog n=1 Tax=Aphantopus hyperantus TaxID=2795564 RepID=UPI001569CF07|nr:vacuolar fusion protein CCZ1 homolog [Maniola hyperantus]XP_034832368.1 vacuolar fusion protein CCZ1 homolog [Maniola hyperantus]XP_034832369.1 vacuolar fusion protein CCZ1 homolog [Maniola hyperantus]